MRAGTSVRPLALQCLVGKCVWALNAAIMMLNHLPHSLLSTSPRCAENQVLVEEEKRSQTPGKSNMCVCVCVCVCVFREPQPERAKKWGSAKGEEAHFNRLLISDKWSPWKRKCVGFFPPPLSSLAWKENHPPASSINWPLVWLFHHFPFSRARRSPPHGASHSDGWMCRRRGVLTLLSLPSSHCSDSPAPKGEDQLRSVFALPHDLSRAADACCR